MVPNPAHSGCESWLQSVWAVGRHLSQSSSAVDAFAAPGTCKQLTPQITVIWWCTAVQTTHQHSLPWRMQRPLCRVHLSTRLVSVQVVAGTHLVVQ